MQTIYFNSRKGASGPFNVTLLKFFAAALLLPLANLNLTAQTTGFWNAELKKIAHPDSKEGWIDFVEEAQIDPRTLFQDYGKAFRLGPDDDMRLEEVSQDKYGFTHYRYDQYYKGIQVSGGTFRVHADAANRAQGVNGRAALGLDLDVNPQVSEQAALETAMRHADGTGFLWLDQKAEQMLKEMEENPNATYFPKGELVIVRTDNSRKFHDSEFALAWQFDIYMGLSGEARRIRVDAHTGQFLQYLPISHSCNPGTGTTTWNGDRNITTDFVNPSYILHDDCTGSHPYTLRTWDLQRTPQASNRINYENNLNTWTDLDDRTGIQTHWGMHETRDYFYFTHGRNSWNGQNGQANWLAFNEAQMIINGSPTHNNATWNSIPQAAAFGGGNSAASPNDDWNTLDIVGHEFTHGITGAEAGLVYSNESGALNESFSDIFGEMVEFSASGSHDWLVGADRGGALRSFSNPNSFGDPDTYLGTFWYIGTNDNGGVHTNSGVQNHWFYLLSEGGSGTNDFGESYNVSGIGIDKAAEIAYLALTDYLNANDEYIDSREATLRAARQIYGACSFEEVQVGKAWYAVHVGNILSEFNLQVCGTKDSGVFQGINSVTGGGGCETQIEALDDNVTFYAGNYIRLRPGFSAVAEGEHRFRAAIEACSFTVRSNVVSAGEPHDHSGEEWLDNDPEHRTNPGASTGQSIINAFQARPNPFSSATTILFELKEPATASLEVFDLNGQLLQTPLPMTQLDSGPHEVAFNGAALPAGVYLCKLIAGTDVISQRLVKVQ